MASGGFKPKVSFTSEQIRDILDMAAKRTPQRVIAEKFGVSQPTIHRILKENK